MNVTLAGIRATSAEIRIPNVGAWIADVDFDAATALPSGKLTLTVGTATFVGTVDEQFSGTFAGRRRVRIVAGSGAWSRELPARHFHNDAGVRDKVVLQTTAEECGETLAFNDAATSVGADYTRQRGRAGAVLARLATDRWYVDYLGVTQVGVRTVAKLGKFDVLDFDSRQNIATIGTSDAQSVGIGMAITDRLDRPLVVRDITIKVSDDGARVFAWGTTS